MFQGSAHVASGQHIALMQAAGAVVNATTWFDRTNYFETLPTGGLDLALWLEADRLATLLDALTQENLDNQREVVKEEKRQRYDNVPYGDVMELLTYLTFPTDHPYGHTTIGSMDDLDAATLDDVHNFFRRHYLPNNAVLSIVGDVEPEDAFERAGVYFGHLIPGPKPSKPERCPAGGAVGASPRGDFGKRAGRRGLLHVAAAGARQPGLRRPRSCLQHARAWPDLAAAQATGPWHRARRGHRGFNDGSDRWQLVRLRYARARDGVSPEDLEQEMVEVIDQLLTDGPTEEELRRAKAQFERHWLHELARVDSRADALGEYATLHGDPHLINSRIAEITAVGNDEVQDVLHRWFRPDQRATLIYRQEA